MGCCSSKKANPHPGDNKAGEYHLANSRDSAGSRDSGGSAGNAQREPTAEEKRAKMLAAAEKRQENWRQGGGGDDPKTQTLRAAREKQELLGKIEVAYQAAGKEVPFGLPAASVEALRKTLENVNRESTSRNL